MKNILFMILTLFLVSCFSTKDTTKKDEVKKQEETVSETEKKDEVKTDEVKVEEEKKETENISNKEIVEEKKDETKIKTEEKKDEIKEESKKEELTNDLKAEINGEIEKINKLSTIKEKIEKIAEILPKYPKSEIVHYNYALLLFESGDIEKSLNFVNSALQLKPTYEKALTLYFNILLEKEDINKARDLIKEKSAKFSDNYEVLFFATKAHYSMKNYKDAIISAKEMLKIEKNDKEGLKFLAIAYYFSGAKELAMYVVFKTEEIDLQIPELYFIKGLIYFDEKKYKEARESFLIAYELNPNFYEAADRLAYSDFKTKKYDDAEKTYRKIIDVYKKPLTFMNFAITLYQLEKNDESLKYFLEAEKLNNSILSLYYNLGILYLTRTITGLSDIDRYDKSVETFEKYNKLLPKKDYKDKNAEKLIIEAKTQKGILQAKNQADIEAKKQKEEELKKQQEEANKNQNNSDNKKDDEVDDKKSDEIKVDDKKSDEIKVDDKKSDEIKVDNKKSDEVDDEK